MKILNRTRTNSALMAMALMAALIPAKVGAQPASEEPRQMTEEAAAKAKALSAALKPTILVIKADLAYSKKDYVEALSIYKSVSEMGNGSVEAASANMRIGEIYELGMGVAANETEAIKYYKLAAAGGWDAAHYNLGNIYYNSQDYSLAAEQFRAFSVKSDVSVKDKAEAKYKLGKLYLSGDGVSQDYALAGQQFAESNGFGNGHNGARYEMGMLYSKGNGVGQDYAEAADHFQKASVYNEAADQPGHPDAQYALSTLYSEGKGVAQNDAEAVKYLRMAAGRDHTKAQFGLGVMFFTGKGVPKSMQAAYLWIARAAEGDALFREVSETAKARLASTNGTAEAMEVRDKLRAQMTPELIAQGQVLVDRCIANSYACNWGD